MTENSSRRRRLRRRGFTMVELVVALALGALLVALLASLGVFQGRPARRAGERLAHVGALRGIYARVSQDLQVARAMPRVQEAGKRLVIPRRMTGPGVDEHARETSAVYEIQADGSVTRRLLSDANGAELEAKITIRTEAPVEVRFVGEGSPDLAGSFKLGLAARTPRPPDEAPDPRDEVRLELEVPDFALDDSRNVPFWNSPAPPTSTGYSGSS